ncbi:MAG: serine hydrolase, partial [Bacteroidetes bacterium]|nr:serine hydrolase [Bacteroidota bacterium]
MSVSPRGRAQSVDAPVQDVMDANDVPGASVAIVHHGDVVYQPSYGVADRASERPATDSTMYQLASATKIIAGTAVMMLVEDERIALDDSVHTHLPELPDAWRGVTVRQAMSHTSGLPGLIDPETGDLRGGATMWTSVPFEETTIGAIEGYGIGWTVDAQEGHRRAWHSGGGKA